MIKSIQRTLIVLKLFDKMLKRILELTEKKTERSFVEFFILFDEMKINESFTSVFVFIAFDY